MTCHEQLKGKLYSYAKEGLLLTLKVSQHAVACGQLNERLHALCTLKSFQDDMHPTLDIRTTSSAFAAC